MSPITWLWTKAAKKVAVHLAILYASWAAGNKLDQFVQLSPEQATAIIFGLLQFLRNKLKVTKAVSWL